jgi:hypothetical protein
MVLCVYFVRKEGALYYEVVLVSRAFVRGEVWVLGRESADRTILGRQENKDGGSE